MRKYRDLNKKRRDQRGASFASCLLTIMLVFGGIGFYYFKVFQWRDFEDPLGGVEYNKVKFSSQLADFQRHTVRNTIDPIKTQVGFIKRLRKETKRGTVKPEEFDQDITELRNAFLKIMKEAKQRRVPKQYKKHYEPCLLSLKEAYESVNALEDSFEQEIESDRKKRYSDSIKHSKKALKKLIGPRNFFNN